MQQSDCPLAHSALLSCAQVQKPTKQQKRNTKMSDQDIFVVYLGFGGQYGALKQKNVRTWSALAPPSKANAESITGMQLHWRKLSRANVIVSCRCLDGNV